MPFRIFENDYGWKIHKMGGSKGEISLKIINKTFKSKDSAIKTAKNYIKFRHGVPVMTKTGLIKDVK